MSTSRIENNLNKVKKTSTDFTNFSARTYPEKAAFISLWIGFGIAAAAVLALIAFGGVLPALGILIPSIVVNMCWGAFGVNLLIALATIDSSLLRSFPPALFGPIGMVIGGLSVGIGMLIGELIELIMPEKVISTPNTIETQPLMLNIAPAIEPAVSSGKTAQHQVMDIGSPKREEDLDLGEDESLRHSMC